jgi:hypothetical protein
MLCTFLFSLHDLILNRCLSFTLFCKMGYDSNEIKLTSNSVYPCHIFKYFIIFVARKNLLKIIK